LICSGFEQASQAASSLALKRSDPIWTNVISIVT
jgi:hypothetical protein